MCVSMWQRKSGGVIDPLMEVFIRKCHLVWNEEILICAGNFRWSLQEATLIFPEVQWTNERQNGWLVFVFYEVRPELIGQDYSTRFFFLNYRPVINEKIKFRNPHFNLSLLQFLSFLFTQFDCLYYSYQKEKRAKPGYLLINWCYFSPPTLLSGDSLSPPSRSCLLGFCL